MSFLRPKLDHVRRALADTTPITFDDLLVLRDPSGHLARSMQPGPGVVPREAAVLLLLYPYGSDLWFPLTVRSSWLPQHRSEVSLPGGRIEPADASPIAAALREADEELGIATPSVEVFGTLNKIYIPPSNFHITPVVGFTPRPPVLTPNPREVDHVFAVSLAQLCDPATVQVEEWTRREFHMLVPFFALKGYKVWGATALLLSEFIVRLQRTER